MISDPRDYKLDISSLKQAGADAPAKPAGSPVGAQVRPFLSVMFNCCKVYQRVYQSADRRSYSGRCPKCLRQVRFVVGQGGTAERSFVVE